MGHENRIWYVECLSDQTFRFVVENIEPCTDETKLRYNTVVYIVRNGVSKTERRSLVEIDFSGFKKLRQHRNRLGLDFNIFMQESRGAKITEWVMGLKKERGG